VGVIDFGDRHDEFTWFHHKIGFAARGVISSVSFLKGWLLGLGFSWHKSTGRQSRRSLRDEISTVHKINKSGRQKSKIKIFLRNLNLHPSRSGRRTDFGFGTLLIANFFPDRSLPTGLAVTGLTAVLKFHRLPRKREGRRRRCQIAAQHEGKIVADFKISLQIRAAGRKSLNQPCGS